MPPPQGQPYGQQPPPPQGQPVQGPPPGQLPPPPGQGQWPQGGPAPKPKKGFPRWLISLIVLVVIGGGVYAFNYFTNDAAQAKAGDCAHLSGTESKPDYKAVGCDSAEATHTVGKTMSSTTAPCGGDYDEFTLTQSRGPDTKLCLFPNMVEGNCYDLDSPDMSYPKVDCGSPKAVKVTKIVKDKNDESLCGKEEQPWSIPTPPRTMCIGAP
jgi:hypothetical protein